MTNKRQICTEVVYVLLVTSPGALDADLGDMLSGLHPPPVGCVVICRSMNSYSELRLSSSQTVNQARKQNTAKATFSI